MGAATAIKWTDNTFNPWWGCTKIGAPGDEPSECDHCYADTLSIRYGYRDGGGSGEGLWGKEAERRFFGDKHWNEPKKWDAAARAAGRTELVFCGSMCDVFEARADLDEHRARLWELIVSTPNLIWQLLTKRPENVLRMVPDHWRSPAILKREYERISDSHPCWPSNAWIGTSVGTQRSADLRVPRLLEIPAPVRFLSCEPLLGPVDLTHIDTRDRVDGMYWINALTGKNTDMGRPCADVPTIGWVIAGGESGPGHRPMDLDWARSLRDQVVHAGVPFFFKQVGGHFAAAGGDLLDGETHHRFPPSVRGTA